jgi:hypothetical protein
MVSTYLNSSIQHINRYKQKNYICFLKIMYFIVIYYHRYSILLCIIYLRHLKLLLVLINFVTFIICFLGWWRIQYLSLLILSFRFTIFFIIYQFMKRQTILSFTCNLSCRISKAYYDRRTHLLWNCKVT